MIPHAIRPYRSTDEGYVYNSWIRSMADDIGLIKHGKVADDEGFRRFMLEQKASIQDIQRGARTVVAVSPLDSDAIMGWACGEPGTLHFVYVGKDSRRMGLCRPLFAALKLGPEATATHHTERGFARVKRCFERLTLDPYVKESR